MSDAAGVGVSQAQFAEALALHERGQFGDAERLYHVILSADDAHLPARNQLGVLRLQQGRNEEAFELFSTALQRGSNSAEAHANLGTALHLLRRHDDAVASFEAALAVDADRAESYYGLALALSSLGRTDEAIACHERALAIDPDYAEANCALAGALAARDDFARAIICYERALDIDPDYVDAISGLAGVFLRQNRPSKAIQLYRKASALQPHDPDILYALGSGLLAAERHDEAIPCFNRVIALAPDHGAAHLALANALTELGRIAEAETGFEKAVAIDPQNSSFVLALINARRVRDGDPVLGTLEALETRMETLDEASQTHVHFASAKALSDLGRDDESFRHLLAGNALWRRTIRYDEARVLSVMRRVERLFTPDFIAKHKGAGNPSPRPIFIVGMPRSGSTLLEQILASHRDILGGGERRHFRVAMESAGIDIGSGEFPDTLATISPAQFTRIGNTYLERLDRASEPGGRATAARVTDKMLANFNFVGLIHLALPQAQIIHIRRDPVDACLSCYSKLFAADVPYAYDLAELGRYHRACTALMDHWQRVLPADAVLEVEYETLVDHFEEQARRVLAYCKLDWDPACLSYHKTERPVRTASVAQVRQPIFRSSIGRWRPAKELLQPLLTGLGLAETSG